MIFKNHRTLKGVVLLLSFFSSLIYAFGVSQEVRPISQLAGTIAAPMEERKQALSAGDKIFVSLDQARPVKKGDLLEIFQPAILSGKDNKDFLFTKVGQVIILEITGQSLLLCEIVSSQREVVVGDRIYFPEN
ncbi:MAG: hypothetical protein HY879_02445 [Deltaproteobacteria bacterium]|nr:hypothetical protein [Deltaproteobacteria bacterium]